MEQQLFYETIFDLTIRPASVTDALAISHLASSDPTWSSHAKRVADSFEQEQSAIAPGLDFFIIVAESRIDLQILGWLNAGGCRGQEFKGWGEIYAFAVGSGEQASIVAKGLFDVAIGAFLLAQFVGVRIHLDMHDPHLHLLLQDHGFQRIDQTAGDLEPLPPRAALYSLKFAET